MPDSYSFLRGTVSLSRLLIRILRSRQHCAEYLIPQQERIVSTDDLPHADGTQPDDRDSLKFLLPKETVDVRRKPLAAKGLYAYKPVCRGWN